jgi:hypothetical protein
MLTELRKKRRSKEDTPQEKQTLLLEVVPLERKPKLLTKLYWSHKKNSLPTNRFSNKILHTSQHATQI